MYLNSGRTSARLTFQSHKDPLFDELDDDEIDNMDTEDAQDVGRTRNGVNAEKEGTEDAVSTEDVVSTDKEKVSTDRSKVSTDRSKVSTDRSKDSTDKEEEGTDKDKDSTVSLDEGTDDQTEARSATPITSTTTPTMFGDDETIAQVLLNMSQAKAVSREKEKGVELKDKRKKKIEEEDESDTDMRIFLEAEKKFKALDRDEEMARKVKRFDESFTAAGFTEDARRIKEMNEGVKDTDQKILKEKDTSQSDDDSDDEHRKCLRIVTFKDTLDSEIMERKSVIARLDKVLHIFDRQDLFHLYELMMEQYSEITLERFELILWGDFKIMMKLNLKKMIKVISGVINKIGRLSLGDYMKLVSLHSGSLKWDCLTMLVKGSYPFSKELLQRMLDMGLEVERESTVALDLIRFIKKQIDEE
ncbi:hypothetical protein Tco_0981093 [Tanacetum coccineum]